MSNEYIDNKEFFSKELKWVLDAVDWYKYILDNEELYSSPEIPEDVRKHLEEMIKYSLRISFIEGEKSELDRQFKLTKVN